MIKLKNSKIGVYSLPLGLAAFLSACATPKQSTQPVSKDLLGVWEGKMNQHPGIFPIRIEFLKAGSVLIGKLFHSSLHCSGTMTLTSHQGNRYEFHQVIEQGRENCLDGRNEILLFDSGTLLRTWYHKDDDYFSTGEMKRVR